MSKQVSARKRRQAEIARQQRRNKTIATWIGVGLLAAVVIGLTVYWLWPDAEEEPTMLQGSGTERALAEMTPEERDGYYSAYPEEVIDPEKEYEAVIRTEVGEMRVRLFADAAPQTVNNFVFLANEGFYDNTTFHRVIENFMAQAGDPSGTGRGGPGYRFADEFGSGLRFDRPGLLAMANAGPATNGSQFFITFVPTPHLDNRHTIFGEVVEGNEVLSQITRREPGSQLPGTVIESIDIFEQ